MQHLSNISTRSKATFSVNLGHSVSVNAARTNKVRPHLVCLRFLFVKDLLDLTSGQSGPFVMSQRAHVHVDILRIITLCERGSRVK